MLPVDYLLHSVSLLPSTFMVVGAKEEKNSLMLRFKRTIEQTLWGSLYTGSGIRNLKNVSLYTGLSRLHRKATNTRRNGFVLWDFALFMRDYIFTFLHLLYLCSLQTIKQDVNTKNNAMLIRNSVDHAWLSFGESIS